MESKASEVSGAAAGTHVVVSGTAARIGPGIRITGEVYSKDDLYIDGTVEGRVEVEGTLTIGPRATVRATLSAGEIILSGDVDGNIAAKQRLEIRGTGKLTGDVRAGRLAIEEGAYFKGSIELLALAESASSTSL
jgi:cytoskeletal protein CcmA (bactofilin family)